VNRFETLVSQSRRSCILRGLAEANGYRGNESLLHELVDVYGFACSRDMVRTELAWLERERLVTLEVLPGGLQVATLSERGLDVAEGRDTVEGVKRPRPR
jgi:hypothetical protein